ncbi:MAG: hypothetical protein ABIH03_03110 [Pseudomonadota bacterium]
MAKTIESCRSAQSIGSTPEVRSKIELSITTSAIMRLAQQRRSLRRESNTARIAPPLQVPDANGLELSFSTAILTTGYEWLIRRRQQLTGTIELVATFAALA